MPATDRSWSARTWSTRTPTTPGGTCSRTPRRSTTRRPTLACSGASSRVWAVTRWSERRPPRWPGTSTPRPALHAHDERQQRHRGAQLEQQQRVQRRDRNRDRIADRDYTYAYTNQWFEEQCNPDTTFTSPQRNDIDAARANLFAMHNRMHDWSYHLGFTEATVQHAARQLRPRLGSATTPSRATRRPVGSAAVRPASRRATTPTRSPDRDGVAPITNMYLWQPIAGSFYAPVRRRRLRHVGDRRTSTPTRSPTA